MLPPKGGTTNTFRDLMQFPVAFGLVLAFLQPFLLL